MPQVYDRSRPSKKPRKGLPTVKKAVKAMKTVSKSEAKMARAATTGTKRKAIRALKKGR